MTVRFFPKLKPLVGESHTFLTQLKNRDRELLSYISDRLYEGNNFDDIKLGLDKILGSRFSKPDVSNSEILWLKETCNDAENINSYQDNIVYENMINKFNKNLVL